MCGVPEHSNPQTGCLINGDPKTEMAERKEEDGLSNFILLELAANNDLMGFKRAVEERGAKVDDCGSWYCRQYGSNKMAVVERTPAMIAALFGSLDVLDYILKHIAAHGGNINKVCGADRNSVLHSAVASGVNNVMEIVKLLLSNGADSTLVDAQGLRPFDGKLTSSNQRSTTKNALYGLLKPGSPPAYGLPSSTSDFLEVSAFLPDSVSETSLEDLDEVWGLQLGDDAGMSSISPLSSSSSSSPKSPDTSSGKAPKHESSKDYPCDSLLSDIKNSVYTTDEFRMYSFKVRPCSRAYSHDWTECPFVHPGENARRRDPRRCHYSCVPCPDFRKGACRHGDGCEYAHGVFESWLHPAQYRTRLCKDGTNCTRRVCFFAHTKEELRPLYLSTESGVPSPRLTFSMDVASMSSPLGPVSPSADFVSAPFSPMATAAGHPSSSTTSHSSAVKSLCGTWVQAGVPSLHLPGGAQGSRLRASLSARDIFLEDVKGLSDADDQLMSEIAALSTQAAQARMNAAVAASACGTTSSRSGRYQNIGLNLSSSNLEDFSASNVALSPRSPLQMCLQSSLCGITPAVTGKYQNAGLNVSPTTLEDLIASSLVSSPRSPSHRSLQSQFDSQMQSHKLGHMSQSQSPNCKDMSQFQSGVSGSQLQGYVMPQSAAQSSSLSLGSPSHLSRLESGFLSPRSKGSPLSPARAILPQNNKRSQNLVGGLLWSDWGSATGKPEWGVSGDDLTRFRKSTSFKEKPLEPPHFSWVQNIFRDGSSDGDITPTACAVKRACSG